MRPHAPSRRRVAPRLGLVALLAALALTLGSLPAAARGARFHGSLGGAHLNASVVDLAPTPGGRGYWMSAEDGGVFAFGDARFFGSTGALRLNAPMVGMAARPRGDGYWLAGRDGGVFAFGRAGFHGSLGAVRLNAPIVGVVGAPDGKGYWLHARDGGVFGFGSARFHGSLGGVRLNQPIVGMAAHPDGRGYWLVGADGGVFTFGSARFHGSLGAVRLNAPIVGIDAAPDGRGYTLVAADGGVFTFGSARFHGSAGGGRLNAPVVDVAVTPLGDGYWLLGRDGGVFTYPGTDLHPGGTPGLRVTTVVSGRDIPWDVAFLPSGTMLFTERSGRVDALVGGSVRVLAVPSDVRPGGEGGMLGLAVDPGFRSNRHVYTCMNTTHGDIRVVKWRVNEGLTGLTRVTDLVTGIPQNGSGRHSGCRPRFGLDGNLWIGTGDAAQGTNPQNRASLGGKVLRVDKRSGGPVPGNPFGTRVFTYGHRNVQGLAFRPGTLQVFTVEHGPSRDDEVNRILAGGNYGWDPVPGYDESVPMTDRAKFPNAIGAVWSSGSPTIATSGATFLSGRAWRDWDGALAVAALKGHQLRVLFLDAAGNVVGQTVRLTGYGRLRSPVLGPDGSLYVTTSNGGGTDRILRVTPV